MQRIALLFVLLLLLSSEAQAQVRPFKYVGDRPNIREVLSEEAQGTYILLYDHAKRDTMLTWVQHLPRKEGNPSHANAEHADLVAWCYPQKYRSKNHIFPNADGEIYFHVRGEIVWITTERLTD